MLPWPSIICAIVIAAHPNNTTTTQSATHRVRRAPTCPTTALPAWHVPCCVRLAMARPPTAQAAATVTTTITVASLNAPPGTTAHLTSRALCAQQPPARCVTSHLISQPRSPSRIISTWCRSSSTRRSASKGSCKTYSRSS